MNTDFMKGVIVPILTPIDENEWIDEIKMREQVDFVINGGVSGILAFGSNGEFYVIEEDEMEIGMGIHGEYCRSGSWPCSCIFRNRSHQYKKMCATG